MTSTQGYLFIVAGPENDNTVNVKWARAMQELTNDTKIAVWCMDAPLAYKIVSEKLSKSPEIIASHVCALVTSTADLVNATQDGSIIIKTMDPMETILAFTDAKRIYLSDKIIIAKQLYEELLDYIKAQHIIAKVSFTYMVTELQRSYGVIYKPLMMSGSLSPCIVFPRLTTCPVCTTEKTTEQFDPTFLASSNIHKVGHKLLYQAHNNV